MKQFLRGDYFFHHHEKEHEKCFVLKRNALQFFKVRRPNIIYLIVKFEENLSSAVQITRIWRGSSRIIFYIYRVLQRKVFTWIVLKTVDFLQERWNRPILILRGHIFLYNIIPKFQNNLNSNRGNIPNMSLNF